MVVNMLPGADDSASRQQIYVAPNTPLAAGTDSCSGRRASGGTYRINMCCGMLFHLHGQVTLLWVTRRGRGPVLFWWWHFYNICC